MEDVLSRTGQDDRPGSKPPTDQPQLPLGQSPRGEQLRRSLGLVTIAWLFGSVYFSSTAGAPITLFAQGLGVSKFQFGLLSALPFIAALLSLPSSLIIDKTGERKWIFMVSHYVHRLLWIPIALVPLGMVSGDGGGMSRAAVTVFLLLVFLNYCGQSIGGPGWFGWMADIVPDRLRGRFFSRRRAVGILSAIPAAILTGWVLDRLHRGGQVVDPQATLRWCGYIFIAAAVFGVIDIVLHHPVPAIRAKPHKHSLLGIFSRPLRDRQFLWFAGFTGTLVFAVSFMGQFVTLFLIEKLKVTNTQIQLMLLVVPALAQLLVLPGWGHAVDRLGRKPVLIVASLGFVPIGFGWCLMDSGAIWLGYILASTGAALFAGVEVANFNLVLELSGTHESEGTSGSTYFAVNNVIANVAGALGGLCSGLIAQSLRNWSYDIGILGLAPIGFYEVLFALSGVLRLLAVVVFLPKIHEPQAKPAAEVLRFMTANVYNNLFSAITMPLRMIRRG